MQNARQDNNHKIRNQISVSITVSLCRQSIEIICSRCPMNNFLCFVAHFNYSLFVCFTNKLIDWLIDWLIDRLIYLFIWLDWIGLINKRIKLLENIVYGIRSHPHWVVLPCESWCGCIVQSLQLSLSVRADYWSFSWATRWLANGQTGFWNTS